MNSGWYLCEVCLISLCRGVCRHHCHHHDHLTQADMAQIAFRKLRQSYIDMGYGVPPEATEQRFRSDF